MDEELSKTKHELLEVNHSYEDISSKIENVENS